MQSKPPRAVGLNDLGELPMRANVALAVRCAERIRPCFNPPANHPRRRELMSSVDGAIRVADAFCRGLPLEDGRIVAAIRVAADVAEQTCEFTRYAGYAAVRAAEAAAHAHEAARTASDAGTMNVVAAAFGAFRVLAGNADTLTLDSVVAVVHADIEKLRSVAPGTCNELGPVVDPSESGPLGALWPDGAPAWCAVKS